MVVAVYGKIGVPLPYMAPGLTALRFRGLGVIGRIGVDMPAIDENELFREVAARVCGRLDIESALSACVEYLRPFVPVEQVFLQLFEPGLGAMRTLARATATEAIGLDVLTPLPTEAKQGLLNAAPELPPIVLINEPEQHLISRVMLGFHGIDLTTTSVVVMPLLVQSQMSKGKNWGCLVLVADRRGAYTEEHARLLTPLVELFAIAMSNAVQHREVVRLKEALADDNRHLERDLRRQVGDEIIGQEFGLRAVVEMIRQVAPRDSPVLLLGETGVGKDVLANAIHRLSSRSHGPFIAVNSGAISESLLDSELFGHEKGAFTGALSRKRGRFERADGGSIFLDEIGELPLPAQVRLLRVLQNREIERVGGTETLPADVRVIAATHRDLETMVAKGEFREDLWFRLNVIPIVIPPLRERKQDIPAFVHFFVERKSRELRLPDSPTLAPGAVDSLLDYDWPGNIRELENVIERSLILHKAGPLDFDAVLVRPSSAPAQKVKRERDMRTLDEVAADHIQSVLLATEFKIHGSGGAAEVLGINPSTLRNRMNKLGIAYRREQRQG